MAEFYRPHRDSRFEYAFDAVEFIEETNCTRCAVDSVICPILTAVSLGENTLVLQLLDFGDRIVCTQRIPTNTSETSPNQSPLL